MKPVMWYYMNILSMWYKTYVALYEYTKYVVWNLLCGII